MAAILPSDMEATYSTSIRDGQNGRCSIALTQRSKKYQTRPFKLKRESTVAAILPSDIEASYCTSICDRQNGRCPIALTQRSKKISDSPF